MRLKLNRTASLVMDYAEPQLPWLGCESMAGHYKTQFHTLIHTEGEVIIGERKPAEIPHGHEVK